MLGVQPALGRTFVAGEDGAGAADVVMLSHASWQRLFGGDPAAVGNTLRLDGVPHTVVGVLPAAFSLVGSAGLWAPARPDRDPRLLDRGDRARQLAIGRIRPGADRAVVGAEMATLSAGLASAYPASNRDVGVRVIPLLQWLRGDYAFQVQLLLGVVAFVLVISCVNIANLLLSRAPVRERAMALRSSLGASRVGLVRLLLVESLLISVAAGLLGLLLAIWGIDLVRAGLPGGFQPIGIIALDGRAIGWTALLCLATCLTFGLVPALRSSRAPLRATLDRASGGTDREGRRIRHALVISEIALAVVLLVGAGALLRTLIDFRTLELGFEPANLLTFSATLPEHTYPDATSTADFRERVLADLARRPAAQAVAVETRVEERTPFENGWGFAVDGPMPVAGPEAPPLAAFGVSAGYLATKRTRLLRGRAFSAADGTGAPSVAIVNQSLVRTMWGNADPIGRSLRLGEDAERPWHTVIGVIEDVRQPAHTELTTVPMSVYLPIAQTEARSFTFYVRTGGEPTAFTDAARAAVAATDPDLPIVAVRTMDRMLYIEAFDRAALAILFNLFAALALGLAALGIYGVISYSVSSRTREIAIRMGLGAPSRRLVSMVVREGARMAILGLAVGLAGAWLLVGLLASAYDDVRSGDPLVMAGTMAVLAGTALLACWLPARRAARVDPMTVLRYD